MTRDRWRILIAIAGAALVTVGVPLTISPLPFGAIVIAFGLALLWRSSRRARLLRRALHRRWPAYARWLARRTEQSAAVKPRPGDRTRT